MAQSWVDDGPTEDLAYTVGGLILGPVGADEFVATWLARPATDIAIPFRTLMDRDDVTDRLGEITAPPSSSTAPRTRRSPWPGPSSSRTGCQERVRWCSSRAATTAPTCRTPPR